MRANQMPNTRVSTCCAPLLSVPHSNPLAVLDFREEAFDIRDNRLENFPRDEASLCRANGENVVYLPVVGLKRQRCVGGYSHAPLIDG